MLNSPIAALPSVNPAASAVANPANGANAANGGAAASDPGAFARQLERAHAGDGTAGSSGQAAQSPAQAPSQTQSQATDAAASRTRMDNERLQRQARQDKAEKAGARPPEARPQESAEAGDGASAASEKADAGKTGDADESASSAPATDAAVLLASLLNRAVPAATAARGSADATRNAAATDGRRAAVDVGAVTAGAAGTADADDASGTGVGTGINTAALRAGRDGTGPALQPAGAETPVFTLPAGSALPGLQAAAGAVHTAAQDVAATPAPYAAQIQAPVGSPDFAPGLSAQVSVMLRDGLQEARLQLNPAEMGPITVQIQIDGNTAQVTMTAEQAPTRNALEQAMPSLAGALREEGLTLTGGGVFEQPRQAQGDGTPAPQAGTRGGGQGTGDGDTLPAAPARSAAPRGIVDVFA